MSKTDKSAQSMSASDAKAEHDDIQREIAESKGLKFEPVADKKPVEETTPEPEADKPDPEATPEGDKGPKDGDANPDGEGDLVDPDASEDKPRRKSLVDRFKEVKTEKDEALEREKTKDAEIARLTGELNRTKTADQMKDKVKVFSEKHGMTEEATLDLILLTKDSIQPDADTRSVLEKSKALIKKQEAIDAFETEFGSLISDVPEASDMREAIRTEAYKDDNLSKSLFEIYHRIKTVTPTRKKTGEAQRPAARAITAPAFNLTAVADKVIKGQSGALEGLTGEQQDQVFAYLDKKGSRYSA